MFVGILFHEVRLTVSIDFDEILQPFSAFVAQSVLLVVVAIISVIRLSCLFERVFFLPLFLFFINIKYVFSRLKI